MQKANMMGPAWRDAREQVEEGRRLLDAKDYEGVKRVLEEVRAWAMRDEVPYPYVSSLLALACDHLNDPVGAVDHLEEAMRQDPLNTLVVSTFRHVMGKLRNTLATPEWDTADARTRTFYDLLMRFNQAEPLSHLAMARHLLAAGKPKEALRILDALVVLAPAIREGWVMRAEVAKELGLDERAKVRHRIAPVSFS